MKRTDHDQFWRMYERDAREPIERACRSAARRLSDNTIDPADMVAWVDDKVWRMLEKSGWPTFHDDPTPEQAIERIVANARVLARWAYLGLCRKHWRRTERQQAYLSGMSRAERLAMVSTVGEGFDKQEQIAGELDKVRATIGPKLAAKLAASWPEKNERHRVAMALGATDAASDELISSTLDGRMKKNTVEQMRSRARKSLAKVLESGKLVSLALLVGGVLALGVFTSDAPAGEQTGGRKGGNGRSVELFEAAMHSPGVIAPDGEQTGGRKGSD